MKKGIFILTLIGSSIVFSGYRTDMIDRMEAKQAHFDYVIEHGDPSSQAEAMDEFYNDWDNELNEIYKLLMSKLSNVQKTKLRNEEREWLKRRERKVNSETEGGTGMGVRIAYYSIMTEWTADRAKELARRYDNLK
jgi:hypothetical protein cdivTM_04870